jgi:hypothetical protein
MIQPASCFESYIVLSRCLVFSEFIFYFTFLNFRLVMILGKIEMFHHTKVHKRFWPRFSANFTHVHVTLDPNIWHPWRAERDTTTWKLQAELRHFEWRRFVETSKFRLCFTSTVSLSIRVPGFVHVMQKESNSRNFQGHSRPCISTEEKALAISTMWRWIVQNVTLVNFKQLCHIWACKINSTKYPFLNVKQFQKISIN